MAYTVRDKHGCSWVRLINLQATKPKVMKPFETEWICDPCNPSRRRYIIEHPAGIVYHAWYEVITNDDSARTRAVKYWHACKVIAAAQELAAAEKAYRELIA